MKTGWGQLGGENGRRAYARYLLGLDPLGSENWLLPGLVGEDDPELGDLEGDEGGGAEQGGDTSDVFEE